MNTQESNRGIEAPTSGQLIDALKSGKLLRRDPYKKGENQWEYIHPYEVGSTDFYLTGWGSAIGSVKDRLMLIITNPELFEIIENEQWELA